MPKLKNYTAGKRVSAHLRGRNLKIWNEIENKSAFLQLALDNAIDLMAWDILKKADPNTYRSVHGKTIEEVLPEFNKKHPLDPLTAKRKGIHNGQAIVRQVEPDSEESNPAL